MAFRIDETGRVRHVEIKSTTLRHPPTLKCIRDEIGGWRFPKPKGGQVVVSYPFIFNAVGF